MVNTWRITQQYRGSSVLLGSQIPQLAGFLTASVRFPTFTLQDAIQVALCRPLYMNSPVSSPEAT